MSGFQWFSQLSVALEPWVIGGLGIYIAFNQWQTSRRQTETAAHRLKLDLFEKRFAVYDAARRYLSSIMTSGKATDEAFAKYFPAIREAKWMLDDEIHEYLNKAIYHQALILQEIEAELPSMTVGDARTAAVQREREIKDWFNVQFDVLDAKFEKFLHLSG
jgi:hypothetical protein